MDNVKNDAYYIKRLKQDLEFVVTHMKNVDIEELNAMKSFSIPCYFVWFKYLRMQKNCQMNISSTEETFHGMQSMDWEIV